MKSRHCLSLFFLLAVLFFSVHASAQSDIVTKVPSQTTPKTIPASIPPAVPGLVPHCQLPPVKTPIAAPIPGMAELDPTTGLHYTGNGKVIKIDPKTYRLEITGVVDYPLKLTYDELRCMPKIEVKTTLVCER